ncbi:unnamed protein product, partial [Amoebophrya sp. A25]
CWGYTGPDTNTDSDMAPFIESRVPYGVEVGTMLIFGPMFREFSCVAGTECKILVEGTGLSLDKNRLFLITGGSCTVVVNFLYEYHILKTAAVTSVPVLEDTTEQTPETAYMHPTFKTDADLPYTETFLTGIDSTPYDLEKLNITRVANYQRSTIMVGPVAVTPGVPMISTLNEYTMTAVDVRGSDRFELCYLADPSTSLNAVNFGFMRIIGPRPAARPFTCYLGSPCILGVNGVKLKRGVNVLQINRKPQCQEDSKLTMDTKAFTNPTPSGFDVGKAIREGYLESWNDAEFYFRDNDPLLASILEQQQKASLLAGTTTSSASGASSNKSSTSANPKDSTEIHYHHFGVLLGTSADYVGEYFVCWRDSPGVEYTMMGTLNLVAPTLVNKASKFDCVLGRECKTEMDLQGFDQKNASEFRWAFPRMQLVAGGALTTSTGSSATYVDRDQCYTPDVTASDLGAKGLEEASSAGGSTGAASTALSTTNYPIEIDYVKPNYFEGLSEFLPFIWPQGDTATTVVPVEFGIPRNARPGRYLLCWSRRGRGHRVRIAEIHVRGPEFQTSECVLGVPCG